MSATDGVSNLEISFDSSRGHLSVRVGGNGNLMGLPRNDKRKGPFQTSSSALASWLGVTLHGLMNDLAISRSEYLPADLDAFLRASRISVATACPLPISRIIGSSSTPGPDGPPAATQ